MDISFLTPFLGVFICLVWGSTLKMFSEENCDYVPYYNSGVYYLFQIILGILLIVGLIIVWVNGGFITFLQYLGILLALSILMIVRIVVNILLSIFGYSGIIAIVPALLGIISSIIMFINAGNVEFLDW